MEGAVEHLAEAYRLARTDQDRQDVLEQLERLRDSLFEEARGGGAEAQAALQSLRALVQRFPENDDCHLALMSALAINSDIAGALEQAEWLAHRPEPTHVRQFNIAQVFLLAKQLQRAVDYYAQAYRLASTDQDRQDVLKQLEYLREYLSRRE
jgi:hypothetical protein